MSKRPLFCESVASRSIQQGSPLQTLYSTAPGAHQWASINAADTPENSDYALIQSAPDVRSRDIELPESSAVDVTVLWGRNVLHAAHITPPKTFSVGQGIGQSLASDFFMPQEVLGALNLTLLDLRGELPKVLIATQVQGYVELPGQSRVSCDELRAQKASNDDSVVELTLPFGSRACLKIGDFSFQFAAVRAGIPIARDLLPVADREVLSFFGASLAAVASFMLSMAYFVPAQYGLDDQPFDEDQIIAMTQYLHASAERERDVRETPQSSNEVTVDNEGGTGTRAKYEEGATGSSTSRATNQQHAIQGPSDNPDPHIARAHLLWEAQHAGIIGLLTSGMAGDPRAPTSPWGRDESLGRDPMSADGNMWGDNIGDAYGAHGLGLTGIGQGAGGIGEGIGLGDFGGLGNGAGRGLGQGFGLGKGNLGKGNHKIRAFRMRPGTTAVSGRLPPEVIQRIVRQNYGRFRSCYEQGLSRNPNLEGRVQVRFIIGRDGTVSNAQGGASDLPDSGVVGCVISAYYGLSFPEPEGGIVTVVYPIMFQPG